MFLTNKETNRLLRQKIVREENGLRVLKSIRNRTFQNKNNLWESRSGVGKNKCQREPR
jgi:hypothetical protein